MSIPKFLESPEFGAMHKIDDPLAKNNKNQYQLRLTLVFTLLSFAVSLIIIFLIYQTSSKSRLAELKTQLTRLTESVSINFSGDTHQKLVSEFAELKKLQTYNSADMQIMDKSNKIDKYYEIVYSKLSRFQKTFNHSRNQRIINIYTMFKKPGITDIFMGAHTDHPEIFADSYFDTIYTSNELNQSEIIALKQAFIGKPGTDAGITSDKTGTKLSGFSPMYDAHNNIVGVIGIDIDASDIRVFKWNFVYFSVIAFALSFFLSLFLATYISGRIRKTLKNKIESAAELAEKSFIERDWRSRILKYYVSEEVEEKIIQNSELFETQPTQSMGTVLNCEIQDFSSLIENRTPEEVFTFLNEYISTIKEIIFKYDGIVVSIVSKSMSAVFGTPYKTEYQAENAVKCALEIRRKLNEISHKNIKNIWSDFNICIGIDSDEIQTGYVGNERSSHFTIAGKAVDFASYLVCKNEELETNILISKSTYNLIQLERETQKTSEDEDFEQTEISPEELCNFEIIGEYYVSIKDSDEQTKVFAIDESNEI